MSFIEDFCEYASGICESPLHFHKVVALYVLSAALERRVYTLHKGQPTYPNIFAMIVGPSARVQKSTIGDIGINALRVCTGLEIFQDRCTRAYLGERLQQLSAEKGESVISIYVPELRTAFNEMTLQEGILEILTRLYDCPPMHEYRLKANQPGGKVISMLKPCISFLGCSTPEWLVTGLSRDEVGGGFAGRCLIVYGDTPHTRSNYKRDAPKRAQEAEKRMLAHLLKARQLEGELELDEGAGRLWSSFRQAQDAFKADAMLKAYHDRKHSHLFKVAMLMSVSRSPAATRVRELDMVNAINLLDELEPAMKRALSGIAPSRVNVEGDRILQVIAEHGGIVTRGELVRTLCRRRVALRSDDLDAVLNVLIEAELVEHVVIEGEKKRLANAYKLREVPKDE